MPPPSTKPGATDTPLGGRALEILEAAIRAIGEQGVHAVRISDIAAQAHVSGALVTYYYPLRSDIIREAFIFADARADARAYQLSQAIHPGRDRLRKYLLLYLDRAPEFYEGWVMWRQMWSYSFFHVEYRPLVQKLHRAWVENIMERIREGQDDGSIRTGFNARTAALDLAAILDGVGPPLLVGALSRRQCRDAVARGLEATLGPRPEMA
jgi:AcrR family transcriptional regulator